MSNPINVLESIDKNFESQWGNCSITVTPEVLEDLKQGKVLHIGVMEEYSVFISVGSKISYEEG